MVFLKYILNNLGRKKKQTFFSFLCLSVSSFIVLADFGLVNSIEFRLKEGINGVLSGYITAYCPKKEGINILESQLTDQTPFVWGTKDTENICGETGSLLVNQRLRIGSLISNEEETSYIHIHALEKSHLERISHMLTFSQGGMATGSKEICISEKMAADLHCVCGDTLLLVAGNIDNYMSDAIGIVSGIFEERGLAIFLNYNGFIPYESGKELAGLQDGMALELILNPSGHTTMSEEDISGIHKYMLINHPELQLITWNESAPLLYSIVKVWKGGGIITQVIFLSFSLIILITLISLIIRSRRKEFSTLVAIGFTWNRVRALVIAEYVLLSFLSVSAAVIAFECITILIPASGIPIESRFVQSAFMTDSLSPFLRIDDILYVTALFIVTTILAVLITMKRLRVIPLQTLLKD